MFQKTTRGRVATTSVAFGVVTIALMFVCKDAAFMSWVVHQTLPSILWGTLCVAQAAIYIAFAACAVSDGSFEGDARAAAAAGIRGGLIGLVALAIISLAWQAPSLGSFATDQTLQISVAMLVGIVTFAQFAFLRATIARSRATPRAR